MISAVVLIGAPGSGKSSVLEALETCLQLDGVHHGAIESEQLSRGYPLLEGTLWTAQLHAALKLQRDAGRRLFLIAATTETAEDLREVLAAAKAHRTLTVCLSARPDTVAERLERREPDRWPGKPALIDRSRTLAHAIPLLAGVNLMIETDERDPEDVALELYAQIRASGLLSAA